MSLLCSCDNCLFGSKPLTLEDCPTPKTLNELKNEVFNPLIYAQYEEHVRQCPGYTTSLVAHVCGAELDEDEDDVCEACQVNYLRQLDYEDDAVERALQRQLDNEEYQLLRLEDNDGDEFPPH